MDKSLINIARPVWGNLSVVDGMKKDGFTLAEEALIDSKIPKEIFRLYHTLWTKAVGTADYDKSEWKLLGSYLDLRLKSEEIR